MCFIFLIVLCSVESFLFYFVILLDMRLSEKFFLLTFITVPEESIVLSATQLIYTCMCIY